MTFCKDNKLFCGKLCCKLWSCLFSWFSRRPWQHCGLLVWSVCVLLAVTARVIWIIHCTDMYYRAHWLFCSVSVSVLSLRSSCGFLLEADRPGFPSASLDLISMELILFWLHINAWYMYKDISSTHVYHPQWNVMFWSVIVTYDLPVVFFHIIVHSCPHSHARECICSLTILISEAVAQLFGPNFA